MPWFKRSDGILFNVLERYDDLLVRLRKEAGWQEVADPTAPPPAPVAVPVEADATPPSPERATTSESTPETPEPSSNKPAVKRPAVKAKAPRRRTPPRRPAMKALKVVSNA
jgi:hypothetical protein